MEMSFCRYIYFFQVAVTKWLVSHLRYNIYLLKLIPKSFFKNNGESGDSEFQCLFFSVSY